MQDHLVDQRCTIFRSGDINICQYIPPHNIEQPGNIVLQTFLVIRRFLFKFFHHITDQQNNRFTIILLSDYM